MSIYKRGHVAIELGQSSVMIKSNNESGSCAAGEGPVVEMSPPFRGARMATYSAVLLSGSGKVRIGENVDGSFAGGHSLDSPRDEIGWSHRRFWAAPSLGKWERPFVQPGNRRRSG